MSRQAFGIYARHENGFGHLLGWNWINETRRDSHLFMEQELNKLPFEVWQFHRGSDNEIWIGCYRGLYKYSQQQFERINSLDTKEIFQDSKGLIWTGTNVGIFRLTDQRDRQDAFDLNLLNQSLPDKHCADYL